MDTLGIPLRIILDGDNCWPDLKEKPYSHGALVAVAALPKGMASGRPSVALRIELDDGSIVVAETSLRLLSAAAHAFIGRYGDPSEDP